MFVLVEHLVFLHTIVVELCAYTENVGFPISNGYIISDLLLRQAINQDKSDSIFSFLDVAKLKHTEMHFFRITVYEF